MPKITKGDEQLVLRETRANPRLSDTSGQQAVAGVEDAVGKQMEQINQGYLQIAAKSAEDTIYTNAVSKATLEFNERYNERLAKIVDQDGNPTYDTLEQDVRDIAADVENKYGAFILNPQTRTKFNAAYTDLKVSKFLQANAESRDQQLNHTLAGISESIFNYGQSMEKDPANADLYEANIHEAINNAKNSGIISPLKAEELRQAAVNKREQVEEKVKRESEIAEAKAEREAEKAEREAEKAEAEAQNLRLNSYLQTIIKGGSEAEEATKKIASSSAAALGISESQYTNLLRVADAEIDNQEKKEKAKVYDSIADKAETDPTFGKDIIALNREDFNKKYNHNFDRDEFEHIQDIARDVENTKISQVNRDAKAYESRVNDYQKNLQEEVELKIRESMNGGPKVTKADIYALAKTPINSAPFLDGLDSTGIPKEALVQNQITTKQLNELLEIYDNETKTKNTKQDKIAKLSDKLNTEGTLITESPEDVKFYFQKLQENTATELQKQGKEYDVNAEIGVLKKINTPMPSVRKKYEDYLFNGTKEQAAEALHVFKAEQDVKLRTFEGMSPEKRAIVDVAIGMDQSGNASVEDIVAKVRELNAIPLKDRQEGSKSFKAEGKVKKYIKEGNNELIAETLGDGGWFRDSIDGWRSNAPVAPALANRVMTMLETAYNNNGNDLSAAQETVGKMFKGITGVSKLSENNQVIFYPPEEVFKSVASPEVLKRDLKESFKEYVPEGAEIYVGTDTAVTAAKNAKGETVISYPVYYLKELEDGTKIRVPLPGRWSPERSGIESIKSTILKEERQKAHGVSPETKGIWENEN